MIRKSLVGLCLGITFITSALTINTEEIQSDRSNQITSRGGA